MFKIRTNSHNASITSLLVTRLYYSNLSYKIEQFVKLLRKSNMRAEVSSILA